MKNGPIGVFDSGFGGLSAVRELIRLMPEEDIVYFGDNARIPYGDKSPETIGEYAAQDAAFLLSCGVKAVLAACGTVSSVALEKLKQRLPVPAVGVIEPAAKEALRLSKNGVIGVMGTEATVRSGAYEKALRALGGERELRVVSVPCPLLVPLVENGYVKPDCEISHLAVREYLAPILAAGADTVILGCTHYPLIRGIIAEEFGRDSLVNTGLEAAKELKRLLAENGAQGGGKEKGRLRLYSSDRTEGFGARAALFLPAEETLSFERVDILSYSL